MQQKLTVLPQTSWMAKHLWALQCDSLSVLLCSLSIVGIGEGLLLLADFGSAPWTVLSQGVALQGNLNIGWSSLIISVLVMLAWIPLRLKVGLGTLLNILVIAVFLGLTTHSAPIPTTLCTRILYAIVGIVLFGVGAAFYLTCHQGAGPRDGLMVGLCQHFHWKISSVRTILEVSACLLGYWLGGTVGVGTLVFAFSIGWVIEWTLRFIHLRFTKRSENRPHF